MALPELTLDNYLARVPPQNRHKLDHKIEKDSELAEIAESYTDWQGTIPYLGLKATDEEGILATNRSARVQRRVVLQKWRERYGYLATYGGLAKCFYEAHRPDMVQAVLVRLGASFSTDSTVKEPASTVVHQTTTQSPQAPASSSQSPSSPISSVSATATVDILDEDNLLNIKRYLLGLEKIHIYNLGLVFGLSQRKVKALMENSVTFLDDVLTAWLRKEDNVQKFGIPGWRTLVKALKDPLLGQTGVASDICKDKGIEDSS